MDSIGYLKSLLDKENVTASIHRQIVLFLIVGVICFVVDLVSLVFLVEVIKWDVIISTGIAVIVATYVAYVLNLKYIFQGGKYAVSKEITLFFIFSIIGFFLNILFMYLLTVHLKVWYVMAKVLITVTVALFNFSTRKWLIFVK